MKTRFFAFLACWFILAAGASATGARRASAPPPQPYLLKSAARPPASRWLVPDAIEEFRIQVDPATVAANPEILAVDLPDGSRLEAVRKRFVVYRQDWQSWSGTLRYVGADGPGTGYANFSLHGDQLTALIDFEGERYRIVGAADGKRQLLVRLSAGLSPLPCGITEDMQDDVAPLLEGVKPQRSKAASGAPEAKLASTRIDVLAVYPRAFFGQSAAVEAAIRTFVQDSIAMANDVFANSQIDAYYNLVGVVPLIGADQPPPPPGKGLNSSLKWMNTTGASGAPAPEVTTLRNAFGADVVTMYIPFEWNGDQDACGIAILPKVLNDGFITFIPRDLRATPTPAFADRAFTVTRLSCGLGDFTLAHEIGHNYGMRHHDDVSTDNVFPNGRGYVFPPESPANATVMGCVCTSSCTIGPGAVCNRIPYFSDPSLTYNGQAIGASTNNNAAVGRAQVAGYAGFKPQSANTPPNANFTKSCTSLTCTFDASNSTDDAAIPSTGYWWDFGDGTTGTGQTVPHTYASQVAERVHLVVTDSGGQTDVEWQPSQGAPPAAPTSLIATATSTSQVSLTWTASPGATSYQVQRSPDGVNYQTVGTPATASYSDATVAADKTYVYRVLAVSASGTSAPSAPDLATTFFFTDDPVTAGGIVKAVHLTQLRTAVNLVRAAAGLAAFSFTDPTPTLIRAVHISELRSALDPARAALGAPALVYTNPITPQVTAVRAIHVQELRAGVK